MWTIRTIDGKPVPWFEPPRPKPLGGLLFLHDRDGRQLNEYPEAANWLDANQLAVASPHGGECWWTDRVWPPFDPKISAEKWLIEFLLAEIESRFPSASIGLIGVGMGGQGALRIAFRHPDRFPLVAALDAAIDFHDLYYEGTPLDELYPSRESCRQDSPVLHVSPVKQPRHILFACDQGSRWHRGNDRLHEKLTALGVAHTFDDDPARISVMEMLQFTRTAMGTESRRLV